jgi:hypothetical protein
MEATSFERLNEALEYTKNHSDLVVLRNNLQCKEGAFAVRDM